MPPAQTALSLPGALQTPRADPQRRHQRGRDLHPGLLLAGLGGTRERSCKRTSWGCPRLTTAVGQASTWPGLGLPRVLATALDRTVPSFVTLSVCSGCPNKMTQTFSQFGVLEVQDQGAGGVVFIVSLPLGLQVAASSLCHYRAFPLCVPVLISSFKETSHTRLGPSSP